MEIKIECGCGTKYKFDVEPVNGRMPFPVQCPTCGNDGSLAANQILARTLPQGMPSAASPQAAPVTATAAAIAPASVRVAAPPMRIAAAAPAVSARSTSLLERSLFLIKERVAVLKLTDTYDILDPATGQVIGIAKEEPPGWAKWLRLVVQKGRLPTVVNIYEAETEPPLVSMRRGFTFLRSKLRVKHAGHELGYFRSKLISLGGGFLVFDHADQQVAEVKGDWKGWNFRFLNKGGREIGTVTKKWAGLGKELFTSADNYVIALTDASVSDLDVTALLLMAGIAIDVVFKEAE